ncbi:hypothetical protein L596_025984 [Steinernema carpocapsae]|uniref:Uncharacterized protein n=1 Tax=Steinernema carpocapsae TaxID=34508 RepID=A0A4U5M000_STECR|nr:hypothetical protein L596_025984 [Steinernema carpocapsae]
MTSQYVESLRDVGLDRFCLSRARAAINLVLHDELANVRSLWQLIASNGGKTPMTDLIEVGSKLNVDIRLQITTGEITISNNTGEYITRTGVFIMNTLKQMQLNEHFEKWQALSVAGLPAREIVLDSYASGLWLREGWLSAKAVRNAIG